jgi:hypothetical protein
MADLALCDFAAQARRAVEVAASVIVGFAAWLLLMPILGFAALTVHAALFGAWPWPAKVMYLGLGHLLGLI